MKDIDWNLVKKDYLQGQTYRALGKKYGVGIATICTRAQKEDWAHAREQVAIKTEQKLIENLSDRNARISVKVAEGVELAVEKTIAGLKCVGKTDAAKIRAYMSVLKDAKDMGIFRSDLDKAEQTARIKKLEREASNEEIDNTITVVLGDGVEEYAD